MIKSETKIMTSINIRGKETKVNTTIAIMIRRKIKLMISVIICGI